MRLSRLVCEWRACNYISLRRPPHELSISSLPRHMRRRLASSVKDMKTSQLEEAEEHAQAGKEPTGSLKTSGHDHQELIQESIESSANNSMGAALDKIRQKLTSKDTRVDTAEDKVPWNKQLNKDAEHGRLEIRGIRQKLMQEIGRLQRDGEVSSDEQHRIAGALQHLTDKHISQIHDIVQSLKKD